MLSVARLLGHFAQPAEAHEAYLVTELGNLFPVDKQIVGVRGNNTNIGSLNAGVTQALLAFMTGITEKEADFQFLTGTSSVGDLHPYSSFFTIPTNVATSSSGYVGTYSESAPHISIPIPNFFSTYRYDNSSNTLRDNGYGENPPAFASVEITAHDNSRKLSRNAVSDYNGFYVYDVGTYAVKLHPGMSYTLPSGLNCVNGTCDRASVISSVDLLSTTPSGLYLTSVNRPSMEGIEILSGHINKNGNRRATMQTETTVSIGVNKYISDAGNIVGNLPTRTVSVEFMCYDPPVWTTTDTFAFGFNSISFDVDGGLLKKIIAKHGEATSTPVTGYGYRCELPYDTDIYHGGWRFIMVDPPPHPQFMPRASIQAFAPARSLYDAGVPVKDVLGYWSNSTSNTMYDGSSATIHNPNNVVANGNDAYMIIEKNTVGSYLDVKANNITNSALRITDLPPDTVFTIADNGGYLVAGVTSNVGEIMIPHSEQPFSTLSGLTLNIFADAVTLTHPNLSGLNVIDHFNNANFNVASSQHNGTVYTVTNYVDMPIPLDDTVIDNVGIGLIDCEASRLDLPYLAGTYNGGDNLLAPVIPGFDRVCYEIGGKRLTLKFSDVDEDSTGYGDTAGGTSDKQGLRGSGTVSTSHTASNIDVTAVNRGTVTFVVEGAVQADTQISYRKGYLGPLTGTPGTVTQNEPFASVFSDFCYGQTALPKEQIIDAVNAADNESGVPRATSGAYVDLAVQKNGMDVLTQRIYSTTSTASAFPVSNAAAQSYAASFLISYIDWDSVSNGHILCAFAEDDNTNGLVLNRWTSNAYVLCSPMTSSLPYGVEIRNYSIRLCHAEPASSCGYDVSHTISNGIFTETLDIPNVEIGDVLTFEMRGGVSSTLDDFECFGVPDGSESSQGSQTFRILTPSVSIES